MHREKIIKSFGVILTFQKKLEYSSKPRNMFLLCKRRDSYSYQDIIRGKWDMVEELHEKIIRILPEELDRLKNHTFQQIWDDFWPDHESDAYTRRYDELQQKFQICKMYIENTDISLEKSDTLWGFPKGKKNFFSEGEFDTALREFLEETKFRLDEIKFLNVNPKVEKYIGSDGKMYQSTYYIAYYLPETEHIPDGNFYMGRLRTNSHSDEIQELCWASNLECKKLLNASRYMMIQSLNDTLLNVKKNLESHDDYTCSNPTERIPAKTGTGVPEKIRNGGHQNFYRFVATRNGRSKGRKTIGKCKVHIGKE